MVLQGKQSNYDTDVFQPLIQELAKQCGIPYGAVIPGSTRDREEGLGEIPAQGRNDKAGEKADIAMRVIADHLRAIAFAIADGQLPSNTGAGYVIRRILRRAVRYGYSFLGFNEPFMHSLVPVLVGQMGEQFPELKKQQDIITNVMLEEEKAFLRTLEQGMKRMEQLLAVAPVGPSGAEDKGVIPGDKAFELLDTFGFPIDLTQLMAREQGREVDMKGFEAELKKQKDRSRAATAVTTGDWTELGKGETDFIGYDELSCEARILRYRKVSGKGGDQYQIVLDRTPFYPEGGGQVGDQGWLISGEDKVEVIDTKRENQLIVHFTKRLPADVGAELNALVNMRRRALTARNHTATHLLHHVLREQLGTHVEQKGSLVAPDRLRFDISHFAKVTPEELACIEQAVNEMVMDDIVFEDRRDVPIEEAKSMGAMALFGEKYGDSVRVVKFGPSVELCGGTHVPRTGVIGPFRIVSESALAAGIRRIEAITSEEAERMISAKLAKLDAISGLLKNPADVVQAVEKLVEQHAALTKELEKAAKEKVRGLAAELPAKAKVSAKGGTFLVERIDLDAQSLKDLGYQLRDQHADLGVVLGSVVDGKPLLAVSLGKVYMEATGLKAGDLIKQLGPLIKGGGGGQPDFATAGGKEPGGMADALKKAEELLG
jgi:alanyl-tRNA synthetase